MDTGRKNYLTQMKKIKSGSDKRYKAKNGFVFPIIYGASDKTISENMGLPIGLIKDSREEFFNEFDGISIYHKEIIKTYMKNGYIETPFGRRRRAPLSYTQIINYPIQSLMSDFTILSLIEASERSYIIPLIIHDNLTLYVEEKSIIDTYKEIKEIMTGWDFEFMNVPLEVECKVGENWYEMIPIEEIIGK